MKRKTVDMIDKICDRIEAAIWFFIVVFTIIILLVIFGRYGYVAHQEALKRQYTPPIELRR